MANIISERKVIIGLIPVADAFAGSVVSTGVNLRNYSNVNFYIVKGAGGTGTSTVTVTRGTDASGTSEEAIGFWYRRIANTGAAGTWTLAEVAGFTTTAAANETYEIALTDQMELLAQGNKPYVRVKMTEVVDSPVLGGILTIVDNGRFGGAGSVG